jgi:hypothetical protein
MRYAQWVTVLAAAATLSVTACNRAQPADDTRTEETAITADERQAQQDAAVELEQRVSDLERDWNEMQQEVASETAEATTAITAEVKEDVANAREAVADLRTTTRENWWERHERVLERTVEDVEQDVRRFARQWTPPPSSEQQVGTTGDNTTWEARRDRLVERIEQRIEAMETALEDVDVTGAEQTEVEDTRARIRKMREDNDRLRNASEEDWWDITRQRVAEYVDRVEQSIRRLDDNRG